MQAIQTGSSTQAGGDLTLRKANAVVKAPLRWKLRNTLRWSFLKGWFAFHVGVPIANWLGIATTMGDLVIRKRVWYDDLERLHFVALRRAGQFEEAEAYARFKTYWVDYGVVSYRVITDVFVAAVVDALDGGGGVGITAFKYHGIGTTNTAEAASDTALAAESTTNLNPDNTRGTGTQTQPSANIYRSTATLTADGSIAAVEHGLLSQAATGGGTLADRSVFSVVTVAAGESIQTQYSQTHNSGG